ncbi:MAG: hypothetical protein ACRCYY_16640 [Trueperaceae bacterium]
MAVKDNWSTGREAAAPGVRAVRRESQPSGREAAAAFASLGASMKVSYTTSYPSF